MRTTTKMMMIMMLIMTMTHLVSRERGESSARVLHQYRRLHAGSPECWIFDQRLHQVDRHWRQTLSVEDRCTGACCLSLSTSLSFSHSHTTTQLRLGERSFQTAGTVGNDYGTVSRREYNALHRRPIHCAVQKLTKCTFGLLL